MHAPDHFQAVGNRHHEVGEHHVRVLLYQLSETILAVRRRHDVIARFLEKLVRLLTRKHSSSTTRMVFIATDESHRPHGGSNATEPAVRRQHCIRNTENPTICTAPRSNTRRYASTTLAQPSIFSSANANKTVSEAAGLSF